MSVAEVDLLHALAHRAANDARDVDDWWGNSLNTALAAVTRARHSSAYQGDAERTLDRLLRWWSDEKPRRISRDVTAMALGARAAADLQRSDPHLVAEAVQAVDDLAERDPTAAPIFHLALCSWALDALVPDRSQAPWPALRERLKPRGLGGVDEPLRQLAHALAAERFDGNTLVQDLLGTIGASPSPYDACVILWIIAAAGERLTQTLGAEDNALKVLLQRRSAIVERLAGEIDERTFRSPEIEEFGATVSEDLPAVLFLSPSEALLLDLALATQNEADAWLSYGEAQALFGERAATATRELEQAQDHHQRVAGLLMALVGLALGLATWTGLLDLDWKRAVAASLAVTVASTVLAVGALLGRAGGAPEKLMEALGSLFVTAAIIAALDALNKHLAHPFISDINGLIIGAVLSILVFAIWQGGRRIFRSRPERGARL